MADQKISELSEANSVASADIFPIVSQGTNKKVSFASMMANIGTDVTVNVSNSPSVSFVVNGGTANETNMLVVNPAANNSKVCINASAGTGTHSERLYVNGNAHIASGTLQLADIDLNATTTDGTNIGLDHAVTAFTGAGNVTFNLADGVEGQLISFVATASGTKTIDTATNDGFNTLQLPQGSSAQCLFANGAWYILGAKDDAVIA